jgi:hypothetical protein
MFVCPSGVWRHAISKLLLVVHEQCHKVARNLLSSLSMEDLIVLFKRSSRRRGRRGVPYSCWWEAGFAVGEQ